MSDNFIIIPEDLNTNNSSNLNVTTRPSVIPQNFIYNTNSLSILVDSTIISTNIQQVNGTSNISLSGTLIETESNVTLSNEIINITGLNSSANVITDISGNFSYQSAPLNSGQLYIANVIVLSNIYSSSVFSFNPITIQKIPSTIIQNSGNQITGTNTINITGELFNTTSNERLGNEIINISGLNSNANVITDISGNFSYTSGPLIADVIYTPNVVVVSNKYTSNITSFNSILTEYVQANIIETSISQQSSSTRISLDGYIINRTTLDRLSNVLVNINGIGSGNVFTNNSGNFNFTSDPLIVGNTYTSTANIISNTLYGDILNFSSVTINKVNATLNLINLNQVSGSSNVSLTGNLVNTATNIGISDETITVFGFNNTSNVITNSSGEFNYSEALLTISNTYYPNVIVVSNVYTTNLTSFGNITINKIDSTINVTDFSQVVGTSNVSITGTLTNTTTGSLIANELINLNGSINANIYTNTNGIFTYTSSPLIIGNNYSVSGNVISNIYTSVNTSFGTLTISQISLQLILQNTYQLFGTSKLNVSALLYNPSFNTIKSNTIVNFYGLDTNYNLTTNESGLVSFTTGNLVVGNVYTLSSNLTSNVDTITGLYRRTQTTTNGNIYTYTTSAFDGNITILPITRNQIYTLSGNSRIITTNSKFGMGSLSNAMVISSIGMNTFLTDFTIDFWFNNGFNLKSNTNSNLFKIEYDNSNLNVTIGFVTTNYSFNLSPNVWYYTVVVFATNQLAIFINGNRICLESYIVYTSLLDELFIQGENIDSFRIVRDSSIYDITQTIIAIPEQEFTVNENTLLLNTFNGPNNSTNVIHFDSALNISSVDFNTFNYYYLIIDAYLSSEKYLNGNNTSLRMISSISKVHIKNLLSYWNGLWTIQFWININSYSNTIVFSSLLNNCLNLSIDTSGLVLAQLGNGTIFNINSTNKSSTSISLNTWTHVALVFTGGIYLLFIGGNVVLTINNLFSIPTNTFENVYLNSFNGYISNLQIDTTSRFSTNFTPSINLSTRDYYTILQNSFNGNDLDTNLIATENTSVITTLPTLIQNQSYAKNNNEIVISNTFSRFNQGSLYLPTNKILTINNLGNNNFTNTWTIEFFLRNSSQTLVISDTNNLFSYSINATSVSTTINSTTTNIFNTLSTNWHFISFTYNQGEFNLSVNGSILITGTSFIPSFTMNTITITSLNGGCYLDELRMSRIIRSNTEPTGIFVVDTNTILLNHFDLLNAPNVLESSDDTLTNYIESISNVFPYTYISYGNVSLNSSIKKFGNNSIYFDGTSGLIIDNMTVNLGTSWTLEFWVYIVGDSTSGTIVSTNNNFGLELFYNSSTFKLELSVSTNRTSWDFANHVVSINTISRDAWNFITITQDTVYKVFINGNQEISVMDFITPVNSDFGFSYNLISNVIFSKTQFYYQNGSLNILNSGVRGIVINGPTISNNPWTIECFFRCSALNAQNGILQNSQWDTSTFGSTSAGFGIGCESSNGTTGRITWLLGTSGGWFDLGKSSGTPVLLNTWHHVAVSFTGSVYRLFLDGVQYITNTSSNLVMSESFRYLAIGRYWQHQFTGFISHVRFSSIARYTTAFTIPTEIVFDSNTTFLVPLTTDSILTYNDSLIYTNTGLSYYFNKTGFSFSTTNFYADGGSLTLGSGEMNIINDINFNTTQPWTFELFAILSSYDQNALVANSTGPFFQLDFNNNGTMNLVLGTGSAWWHIGSDTGFVIPLNTWHHFAVVFSGTQYRVYMNGIEATTMRVTSSTTINSNSFKYITLTGIGRNISHFRLSNIAVYTNNFTKPTNLTPDSNTVIFSQLTALTSIGLIRRLTPITIINPLTFGFQQNNNSFAKYYLDELNFVNTQKYITNFIQPTVPLNYRSTSTILSNHLNSLDYFTSEETTIINAIPIYTLINGFISTTDKYFGSASCFLNSTGFLYMSNLNLTTTYTIEFFYKFGSQVSSTTRFILGLSTGETLSHSGTAWTHTTPSISNTVAFDTGNWYYICYTRVASSLTINIINTNTNARITLTGTTSTLAPSNIYFYTNNTSTMYIDNVRISNTAIINTTVPTTAYTEYSNTVVLINNFNGSNNSTDVIATDVLYNSVLTTSTSNSFTTNYQLYNCAISNLSSKYGTSSLSIDGNSLFSFLTVNLGQRYVRGNWTIEFWFNPISWGEDQTEGGCLFSTTYTEYVNSNINTIPNIYVYIDKLTGKLTTNMFNTIRILNPVITKNTWHHFALVHNGNGNYSIYLNGTREINFGELIVVENVFSRPIIVGRQFVYNTAPNSYSFTGSRLVSKNNFNGFIDELMISKNAKYIGTTVTFNVQQTQSFFTILFNHFENADIIQSEDTSYITTYTQPAIYLTSSNASQGLYSVLSKEYTKFSSASLYIQPTSTTNAFTYSGLGFNAIFGSWTFEIWLLGTFTSNIIVCATNISNIILEVDSSVPSNLRPTNGLSEWTHYAVSFDTTTNTEYLYVNGTLYNTIVNPPVIYSTSFDKLLFSTTGGYIDSFKLSSVALYTGSNFTNYNNAFVSDNNTVLIKTFIGPHALNITRLDNSLTTFSSNVPGILTDGQIYEDSIYRQYNANSNVLYYTFGSVNLNTSIVATGSTASCLIDNRTVNSIFTIGLLENYIRSNFTLEFWFRPVTTTGVLISDCGSRSSTTGRQDYIYLNNGVLTWKSSTFVSGAIVAGSRTLNTSTWYHIAVVYDYTNTSSNFNTNLTNLRIYLNGTIEISVVNLYFGGSDLTRFSLCTPYVDSSSTITGLSAYIDLLRISNIARYTSSFTPATTFTKDNNTISLNTLAGTNGSTNIIGAEDLTSVTLTYGTINTTYNYHTYNWSSNKATISLTRGLFKSSSLNIPFDSFVTINGQNSNAIINEWTIEYWAWSNTPISINMWKDNVPYGNDKFQLVYNNTLLNSVFTDNFYLQQRVFGTLTINAWNHIAIVFNKYRITYYINGTRVPFYAQDTVIPIDYVTMISSNFIANLTFTSNNGFIDSLRISNNARYISNFSVPTSEFSFDSNTILLNNFNLESPATVFNITDLITSSTYNISSNFELFNVFYILLGSPVLSETQAKFGSKSLYITTNSYVFVGGLNIGNIWSIEFWFYVTSNSPQSLVSVGDSNYLLTILFNNGSITMFIGNAISWAINSSAGSGTFAINTWHHLSAVATGSAFRLYINGSLNTNIVTSSTLSFSSLLLGVTNSLYHNNMTGYIDEFTVSNTVLRTSTFTAPLSASFVRPSNLQVLNHFDNTTLINSEDPNYVINTVYTLNNPVTLYIPGYHTNGSTDLYTSTGIYAPIQYPIDIGSVFSFSNTISKFGSTSLRVPVNNSLIIQLPGVSCQQFTVDFWYSPISTITISNSVNLIKIGGVEFVWNLSRLITNYGAGTSSNNTINIGTWYYIQLFFTQATITAFVNGTQVHSFTHSSTPGIQNLTSIIINVGNYNNFRFMNNFIINMPIQSIDYSYLPPQLSTQNFKFGTSSLRLSLANNLQLNPIVLGSNWTIEFWFYSSNMTSATVINSSTLQVVLNNTNLILIVNGVSTTSSTLSNFTNNWNHLAIVYQFGTTVMYLNGVLVCSYLAGLSVTSITLGPSFDGFIDELRISKKAVYTDAFTPSNSEFTFDKSNIILNHFNGTNGSTLVNMDDALIDFYGLTYETASNGVIYQNYGVSLSSNISKYGTKSAYFNGMSSYFTAVVPFTNGNYTIQGWVYILDFQNDQALFGFYDAFDINLVIQQSTRKLLLYIGNGYSWTVNSTFVGNAVLAVNTWYWISVVFTGSAFQVYVNGTLDVSLSGSNLFTPNIVVGRMVDNQGNYNTNNFFGYIDDFTIINENIITTPTSVLTPFTYTLLLNNFEETTLSNSENTSTKASYTKPYTRSYYYIPSSCTFYLETPLFNCNRAIVTRIVDQEALSITNINSNLFNTSWTIETWAMWTSLPNSDGRYGFSLVLGPVRLDGGGFSNSVTSLATAQSNGFRLFYCLSYNININISPILADVWNHYAVTYDGTTINFYMNGVLRVSVPGIIYANNSNLTNISSIQTYTVSGIFMNGYRVSNSIRYTSNFSVPTDFFSYDSNTLMLLNVPNNSPKFGYTIDVYDEVLYPIATKYTSNLVPYYWLNNGASIATVPSNILGNTTALFCENSSNLTGTGSSFSTVVLGQSILSGDFTIELWFYTPTIVRTNQCLLSFYTLFVNTDNRFFIQAVNYSLGNVEFGTLLPNTWYHFAICYNCIASTFTHYINGVRSTVSQVYIQYTRITDSDIMPLPYVINLGCTATNTQNFNGYISNFRISSHFKYWNNFGVLSTNLTRDIYTVVLNPFNSTANTVNLMTSENLSLVNYVNPSYNIIYSYMSAASDRNSNNIRMTYSTTIKPFVSAPGSLQLGNNWLIINGIPNNFGQNSWTFETWFMITNQMNELILMNRIYGLYFAIQYINTTTIRILFTGRTIRNLNLNSLSYGQNYSLNLNTWCHAAVSFDGNTYRLFIGGTLLYSNSFYNTLGRVFWNNFYIGANDYIGANNVGCITGLRFSDTCRYTTTFTPSTNIYTFDSNTIVANYFGPDFSKFELYDIADQVNNISTDNSTTYLSNNATLSSAQAKFGTKSLYLTGDNSFVKIYPSIQWYGSFTIQFWFYLESYVNNESPYLVSSAHGSLNSFNVYINSSTNRLILSMAGNYINNNIFWMSNTNLSTGVWYHFAFCYDPVITTNSFAYLNGSLNGNFWNNTSFTGSIGISNSINGATNNLTFLKGLVIGRQLNSDNNLDISTNSFNGYIDEFIYSNYPKYNSTVLPSTLQKTRDQYDLVFNNFEGTTLINSEATIVNGYTPNYNYSYFDPITNTTNETTLSSVSSSALPNLNTSLSFLNDRRRCVAINNLVEVGGSYTVEFWYYLTPLTRQAILHTFVTNTSFLTILINTNYTLTLYGGNTTVTMIPNRWNHIAIQYNLVLTNIEIFVNGALAMSLYLNRFNLWGSTNKILFRNYFSINNFSSSYYISNLRISNIIRYPNRTFTVPTSYYTIDANTLVINQFNGIDRATNLTWYLDPILLGNTNLTFVTNPSGITYINFGTQLSNTQTKFGSTSLNVNNAYLVVQNILVSSTEWTIEIWYFPLQSSGTVVCDYRANFKLAVIHSTSLFLFVGDEASWSIANGLTSGNNVSTNNWHHIAIVFSGLAYYLYLDGNLEISVMSTFNVIT